MANRPNLFDKVEFQKSLKETGCPNSFIQPATSDLRLFVPMLLHDLGEEKVHNIVERQSFLVGLGNADPAWETVIKYLVLWAKKELVAYSNKKSHK